MTLLGNWLRPVAQALASLLVIALINVASAADIKAIGGSAVIPGMEILIPQFERTFGHKVIADFDGAIGAMTKRIQAGEAADVVIVSKQQIGLLEKDGRVVAGSGREVAKLGVGVFVRKGAQSLTSALWKFSSARC